MKLASHLHDPMKRKLLTLLASLPMFAACRANGDKLSDDPEVARLQKKFRGIYGVVLRLDATSPKHGITITDGSGRYISAPGGLGPKGIGNQTYTDNSMPIPRAVRATWRQGKFEQKPEGGGWNGGTIIGDYTVPVSERIPDELLDYIRKNGGALRLKIRLADDGILIGWDIEQRFTAQYGSGLRWILDGGDFKETRPAGFAATDAGLVALPRFLPVPLSEEDKAMLKKYALYVARVDKETNTAKIWEKGWYIDKNGRKVLTDY